MAQKIKKKIYFGLRKLGSLLSGTNIAKIFLLRRFYTYFLRIFRHSSENLTLLNVNGLKMYVDKNDFQTYSCLSDGWPLEGLVTDLFIKNIKSGMSVVDVGANIGYYTLLAAKLVGLSGKVYAFEPEPNNFSVLLKNIAINNFQNVFPSSKSISNKDGAMFLYLAESNREGHRIYNLGEGRKNIAIESLSLDNFFKGREECLNFVKIDVEGAEVAVLRGMQNILDLNNKMKMLIEFNPFILKKSHFDPNEFLEILFNAGFRISIISDKILRPCREKTSILTVANQSGLLNLFCEK